VPDVLTRDEVAALTRVVGRGRTAIRNKALVVLMWRTGLRISEALALVPSSVDRDARTLHVRRGKGGKSRTVPIDVGTEAILEDYAKARASYATGRRSPLFCTLDGKTLAQSYVRTMLSRLAERAQLAKHVHPHMLRATYASELMVEGKNVRQIQELLGHADLSTTVVYLRSIGALPDLIEAIQSRPPFVLDSPHAARARAIGAMVTRGRR
jgi:site-specific recombinase XerD